MAGIWRRRLRNPFATIASCNYDDDVVLKNEVVKVLNKAESFKLLNRRNGLQWIAGCRSSY